MGRYCYDNEGFVIKVYGRYAMAVGFHIAGEVVIKAKSLSLKLRAAPAGSDILSTIKNESNLNGTLDNLPIPNLAKVLCVGDRISFDAEADSNGTSAKWLASIGSVRVVKICTDSQRFMGDANVVELNSTRGVLLFADKRIAFDSSATFPIKIEDLTTAFSINEDVSFVALDQPDVNDNCQWRAISVEKRCSDLVRSCSSESPGAVSSLSSPSLSPTPSTPPSLYHSRSPISGRRDRRLRNDMDEDAYRALPPRIEGYGRVTYYGPRCSLLKDLDTHRLVFFPNDLVEHHRRSGRSRLRMDDIVYFEAYRTKNRANLHAYFDARRVCILDPDEEDRLQRKLRRERMRKSDCNGSSCSTSSSRMEKDRNRRFSYPLRVQSSERRSRSGKHYLDGDQSESSPKRSKDDGEYEIDRSPFDDKVERVLFDKKSDSYGKVGRGGERDRIEVIVAGEKRTCVLDNSVTEKSKADPIEEFEKLLRDEEEEAQMYEFEDS